MNTSSNVTQSFSLVWQHKHLWVLAFIVMAILSTSSFILNLTYTARRNIIGITAPYLDTAPPLGNVTESFSNTQVTPTINLMMITVASGVVIVLIIAFLLYVRAQAGIMVSYSNIKQDIPTGFKKAWKDGGPYWGRLLKLNILFAVIGAVIYFIYAFILVAGLIFSLFGPGATTNSNVQPSSDLALFGLISCIIFLFFIFSIVLIGFLAFVYTYTAPFVVYENESALQALSSSIHFVRKNIWKILKATILFSTAVIVIYFISGIASFFISAILIALTRILNLNTMPETALGFFDLLFLPGLKITFFVNLIINTPVQSFVMAATTVFFAKTYFDLKQESAIITNNTAAVTSPKPLDQVINQIDQQQKTDLPNQADKSSQHP